MKLESLIKEKSYEHVIYVMRRHWITFMPFIALLLVLLILPGALAIMIFYLFPNLFENQLLYISIVLFGSIYYLTIYLVFFSHFIDFYLDLWIVTNDRIIDIEQFGLFSRTISELDLFRIQDVTTDVRGFLATYFQYGDVTVKTASDNVHIIFKDIPNPNKVREHLIRLSHEDRKYHYSQDKDEVE